MILVLSLPILCLLSFSAADAQPQNSQAIIFPGQWRKIKSKLLESRSSRRDFLPRRKRPAVVPRSDSVIFPGKSLLVDRSKNVFTGHNLGSRQQPKSLPPPKQPVSVQPATFSIQNSQIDHSLSQKQEEMIPIYISQGHRGGIAYHLPAYVSHSPGLNFHTHDGSFHAHTQLHHITEVPEHPSPSTLKSLTDFSQNKIQGSFHAHTQLQNPHQHEVPVQTEYFPTLDKSKDFPKSTIQAHIQLHDSTTPQQFAGSTTQTGHPLTSEKEFSQNTIQGFEAREEIIPDQVFSDFPGQNFIQVAANQNSHSQFPSPVNHLGFSQQPSPAQASEIQPSLTPPSPVNPPKTNLSLPQHPSRASPASARPLPHQHLEETFGAKSPLIEPFFPILPPASISPDGGAVVRDEKLRDVRGREEEAVGSGQAERAEATVIETESRPLKAEDAVPSFVSLAGRFPPRTRLQEEGGRQETEKSREVTRPSEAPRQGAPREGPKLDFMELLH